LEAPPITPSGAENPCEALSACTTYNPPPLMNASSSTPPFPAAITGCEEGPARVESICSGARKTPPSRRDTNTCWMPPTFFI
jgi:hypothetical protein